MKIVDLLGEKVLTGIDRTTVLCSGEYVEVVRIILDGVVVQISENPCFGYRSYHDDPCVVDAKVMNTFSPVTVICEHETEGDWHHGADILRIRNAATEAVILEVGTGDVNAYYPCFVSNFSAEALGVVI